jgi:hypothetical protein
MNKTRENFSELVTKLLHVPHMEVKEKLDKENAARKQKKAKRPSSASREADVKG